jgi:hypothetical protein
MLLLLPIDFDSLSRNVIGWPTNNVGGSRVVLLLRRRYQRLCPNLDEPSDHIAIGATLILDAIASNEGGGAAASE